MTDLQTYEIYAIKYAEHERRASENFIGGDIHDGPMPMDYFVWAVVGESRTYVVDTGFDAAMAERRGRTIIRSVAEGLQRIGVDPAKVEDVVVTHMHYDHAGNIDLFPRATFHLQDREMAFCTGRCMCHEGMRHPFAVEDVKAIVDRLYSGRVQFHDGDADLAPGLTLHRTGGHTAGLQVLRVWTERGWVVLASDATHYYANLDRRLAYPVIFNVADMLEGYDTLLRLADSEAHIIPGHDPQVLKIYPPAFDDSRGWIARLDQTPSAIPEI